MRDEQDSARRIRAAAEQLRQVARRLSEPHDRMALISVASSLESEATTLDTASISATRDRRGLLEREFDRGSR